MAYQLLFKYLYKNSSFFDATIEMTYNNKLTFSSLNLKINV